MKKHFLIVLVLMFIGAFALINIGNTAKTREREDETKVPIEQEGIVSSTEDLIMKSDRVEPELYNPEQMYFENVHFLADYLTFKEIEEVKLEIQSYIHSNIDQNILDCFIDITSIWKGEEELVFECKLPNAIELSVGVKRGIGNEVIVGVVEKES